MRGGGGDQSMDSPRCPSSVSKRRVSSSRRCPQFRDVAVVRRGPRRTVDARVLRRGLLGGQCRVTDEVDPPRFAFAGSTLEQADERLGAVGQRLEAAIDRRWIDRPSVAFGALCELVDGLRTTQEQHRDQREFGGRQMPRVARDVFVLVHRCSAIAVDGSCEPRFA